MKQTAVDWLVDQVENFNCMKLGLIPSTIIEKAKEMEREQIEEAFYQGCNNFTLDARDDLDNSAQYYKENYE